jgi:hypothetical protein
MHHTIHSWEGGSILIEKQALFECAASAGPTRFTIFCLVGNIDNAHAGRRGHVWESNSVLLCVYHVWSRYSLITIPAIHSQLFVHRRVLRIHTNLNDARIDQVQAREKKQPSPPSQIGELIRLKHCISLMNIERRRRMPHGNYFPTRDSESSQLGPSGN